MYYVYVICNQDGKVYVGYTADLRRRIKEHKSGGNISTRNQSWELVYYEAYLSREDALQRERKLKQRGQAKRYLKGRVQQSLHLGCVELGARLKAPSRREGR